VHLLYLDDSGSPTNKNEEYFVLGGVSVPEQSIRWLSYEIEKLAIQIDGQNPRDVEFHAAEMYSTRGRWSSYSRAERIENIKAVLRTMDRAYQGVTVFACAVHKPSFPNADPFEMAFEELADRFAKYLSRMNENDHSAADARGLIVLDKSTYENSLQSLATQFRHKGNRWGNQLRNLCEVPLFIDSKAARITQLADHIAYAVFRRFNANDINYFNCIEGRFDRNETSVFGLVHLQHNNPNCTCPACVTRKR
jgi:hypothetical protein